MAKTPKHPFNEARFKQIAGEGTAEFYNFLPRSKSGMPTWEIKANYPDGTNKIVILRDCGAACSGEVIEIQPFTSRAERNEVIYNLYRNNDLSQNFLGDLFHLTQSTISLVVNGKKN